MSDEHEYALHARRAAERLRDAIGRTGEDGLRLLQEARGLVDAAIASHERAAFDRRMAQMHRRSSERAR